METCVFVSCYRKILLRLVSSAAGFTSDPGLLLCRRSRTHSRTSKTREKTRDAFSPVPIPTAPTPHPARGGHTRVGGVHQLPKRWPAPPGGYPGAGGFALKPLPQSRPGREFRFITAPPRKGPAPRTAGECESLSALQ